MEGLLSPERAGSMGEEDPQELGPQQGITAILSLKQGREGTIEMNAELRPAQPPLSGWRRVHRGPGGAK
jgi:hypothetical protein